LGDRSVLAHITGWLNEAGVSEFVLNVHHLADRFEPIIKKLHGTFHLVHEPEIRGTAGGIAGARHLLEAPLLVWNGDIVAEPPVEELLAATARAGLSLAICARSPGMGTAGVGSDGRITRLRGERFGEEALGGDYIGVLACDESTLRRLPDQGCVIGDCALPALRAGEDVAAVMSPGQWTDLGSVSAYHAENLRWLVRRGLGHWVASDADVSDSVELRASIVGSGARVAGSGALVRCVVWPGARVEAPLSDAVVTTRGRVVRPKGGARK
jgi:NDP-sugar pyrophosphorylase family protein